MATQPDSPKIETRQARMSNNFLTKMSVIANALSQTMKRDITIAEAAEISLGEDLEREYSKALDQLTKLKRKK